jgi:arginase family enzyme
MAFDVTDEPVDTSDPTWNTIPTTLADSAVMHLTREMATRTREMRLKKSDITNRWSINGRTWEDVVASGFREVFADPALGDVEIWRLDNRSGGWFHPIHTHLVDQQILSRNGAPPFDYELGPKDVAYVGEDERVEVIMQFGPHRGRYMIHCHNLSHEDHDMMAQFSVGLGADEVDPHDPIAAAPAVLDEDGEVDVPPDPTPPGSAGPGPEPEPEPVPEPEPEPEPVPVPVPTPPPAPAPEPVSKPRPRTKPKVEPAETAAEAARGLVVVIGSPTALGGHFEGMDRGPAALRNAGLLERLRSMPGLAGMTFANRGDAPIERGWAADDDPRMKNRQRIIDYLRALADHVEGALGAGPGGGDQPRLLLLGGDCTSNAGAMAGLKGLNPDARFAIAWFDAHGDFNTPETTPSGNVWGMPLAMICGRGDEGLVAACDGPTVYEDDVVLLGGQVLDERESRMLAAAPVAHFGSGMLAGDAGLAALEGWARTVSARTDGLYIAFDLDAVDRAEGVSVAMPESDGLSVETAVAALRVLATTNRVIGFGPTATMPRPEVKFSRHLEIVARLTEAALG